jgi:hypothetical protein
LTPRTLTAPPTDRGMWRRLLRLAHPDSGAGDHSLFVWVTALRDHVAGDTVEDVRIGYERTQPPHYPPGGSRSERVPFDYYADFDALTDRAVTMGDAVAEPFAFLLRSLAGCYRAEDGPLYYQQRRGATYKQLAALAYRVGMSKAERVQFYRIAEAVPLSQRHVGHIFAHVQGRAA